MSFYDGKKVFIVGGSAGIGQAAALQLVRQGAHVFVAARGQQRLDETVELMKAVRRSDQQAVGSVSMDVTDVAAVRAAAETVLSGLGGLDVLVCNSGFATTGCVQSVTDDSFDEMMSVNYRGHVNVVRAFAQHFIDQGSGDICLVSSMLGFMGLYGYSAYSASKFAIVGFAEALRQEMMMSNVRVTLLYPPTTDTPGLKKENESKPAVVWALEAGSGWNKTYSSDEVATVLLKSIQKGRFSNVVGWDSVLIYTLNRYLPGLTRFLADDELKKAFKKVEKEA
jgi:NAD(P)-dependent dehydrogenase (short-subunit alcohol dehydrogenase family)